MIIYSDNRLFSFLRFLFDVLNSFFSFNPPVFDVQAKYYQELLEKEKYFIYFSHIACDNNTNFILDFYITSGNIHYSVAFSDLYKKIKLNFNNIKSIAIDAGYITIYICKTL